MPGRSSATIRVYFEFSKFDRSAGASPDTPKSDSARVPQDGSQPLEALGELDQASGGAGEAEDVPVLEKEAGESLEPSLRWHLFRFHNTLPQESASSPIPRFLGTAPGSPVRRSRRPERWKTERRVS